MTRLAARVLIEKEVIEMARFWLSWEEPIHADGDCRPLKMPLPPAIVGWWCSGYGHDYASICAVVDAPSAEDAKLAVAGYWHPSAWRFCDEKPADWRPGDRFPAAKEV